MTSRFLEIFTKEYLKEYFSRNKVFIIIATILLILSSILGVLISDFVKSFIMQILENMVFSFPSNASVTEEAIYLFQNNIQANILIMLGGFLFSIFSVLSVIFNGIIIGFTYTLVTPLQFFVGIVPHGIFELPALILALTGAFNITKLEINLLDALFKHKFKEELGNSKTIITDIILTFLIILVLLIFAAVIEAAVTPLLLVMVS